MFSLCVSLIFCCFSACETSSVGIHEEFIFEQAPFPQCHASTIVETKDGTLCAAWFGGTHENHPDVGIWVSRRIDGTWTVPVEAANGIQNEKLRFPCWNPVLFQPQNGPLMLFFKVGKNPAEWRGEWMISEDDGQTWVDRKKLPDGFIGPVKNKPVQLKDGTILAPSSTENDGWKSHFEWSCDDGKTWEKGTPIHSAAECESIQPTILFHSDGRLQMLARNRSGNVLSAFSSDGGRSWGKVEETNLPNPNSGIDAVTLRDGRHLLVYNPTETVSGKWGGRRNWLAVAISSDGLHWERVLTLEKSEDGEFSYPAVIETSDKNVHITYTWRRQKIKHVEIPESVIKSWTVKKTPKAHN